MAEAACELEAQGEAAAVCGQWDVDDGHAGVGPREVHDRVTRRVEAFGGGAGGGGGQPGVDAGAVHGFVEALAELDAAGASGFEVGVGDLAAGEEELC